MKMNIPAHVINKVFSIVIAGFFSACLTTQSQRLFEDTFEEVVMESVLDLSFSGARLAHHVKKYNTLIKSILRKVLYDRYNRPPTFEESQKGIEPHHFEKRPDSLNKLRVIVASNPISVDFSDYKDRLPQEYKFVMDESGKSLRYIPKGIEDYPTEDYHLNLK